MIDKKNIKDSLTIVIITYNRSIQLQATLQQFKKSLFSSFKIVVLNNCSTDNTVDVVNQYISDFENLTVITNKFNIGLAANIMRAYEYSDTEYCWVIADDDNYDFSDCEDVLEQLLSGKYDILQVGGHDDREWLWGTSIGTPKQLQEDGYPYFKYSSFIASTILRTSIIPQFAIEAYRSVANVYPHMPIFFAYYNDVKPIYISKKRLVYATPVSPDYNLKMFFDWWLNTSRLLNRKRDKCICFFQQFNNVPYKGAFFLLLLFVNGKISIKQLFKAYSLLNVVDLFCLFLYSIVNLLSIIKICLINWRKKR